MPTIASIWNQFGQILQASLNKSENMPETICGCIGCALERVGRSLEDLWSVNMILFVLIQVLKIRTDFNTGRIYKNIDANIEQHVCCLKQLCLIIVGLCFKDKLKPLLSFPTKKFNILSERTKTQMHYPSSIKSMFARTLTNATHHDTKLWIDYHVYSIFFCFWIFVGRCWKHFGHRNVGFHLSTNVGCACKFHRKHTFPRIRPPLKKCIQNIQKKTTIHIYIYMNIADSKLPAAGNIWRLLAGDRVVRLICFHNSQIIALSVRNRVNAINVSNIFENHRNQYISKTKCIRWEKMQNWCCFVRIAWSWHLKLLVGYWNDSARVWCGALHVGTKTDCNRFLFSMPFLWTLPTSLFCVFGPCLWKVPASKNGRWRNHRFCFVLILFYTAAHSSHIS